MSERKEWRNRIVGETEINPSDLVANPANWRAHPKHQQAALSGLLNDVGWVQRVIVNKTTGHIVDGHARVALAVSRKERLVPVLYVELEPAEEKLVLASLDPIGAMATSDEEKLEALLNEVTADDEGLQRLLDDLGGLIPEEDEETEAQEAEDIEVPDPALSLSDRFMVPPFTVLNAREGWWRTRKQYWVKLGIESEVGRGEALTYRIGMFEYQSGWSERDAARAGQLQLATKSGVQHSSSPAHGPNVKRGPDGKLQYEDGFGTSIFDPVLTEIAYRWFCPPGGVVLDPFAGGSVRGIVAGKLNRDYVGHELRPEQVEANRAQGEKLCGEDQHKPRWVIGDSRTIDKTCKDVAADLVFSCPPYADLEKYSDEPDDLSNMPYEDFLKAYREIIAKSCSLLKNDRFACFVVGEARGKDGNYYNLVGDTIVAFKDAGLGFYNEAILVTSVGSLPIRTGRQFASTRKLGKCHQNVLVFVKGDVRRAVEACGDVEVIVPDEDEEGEGEE